MQTILYRKIAHVTSLWAILPRMVFADEKGMIECRDLIAQSCVVFMKGIRVVA